MNTRVHSSQGDQDRRNTDRSLATLLEHHRPTLQRNARLAHRNPNRRSILKLLVTHPQGVTYQTLCEALSVGERWIRAMVADLRRDGIVTTEGNPALIQFATRGIMLAVKELLAFLASDWVEAVTDGAPSLTALPSLAKDKTTGKKLPTYLKTMVKLIRGERG